MKVLVILLATLATAACRTPGRADSAGYNPYAPLDAQPLQQVDGVKYRDPGREVKVRNAFNTFRM